jgi:hypothetical protein
MVKVIVESISYRTLDRFQTIDIERALQTVAAHRCNTKNKDFGYTLEEAKNILSNYGVKYSILKTK